MCEVNTSHPAVSPVDPLDDRVGIPRRVFLPCVVTGWKRLKSRVRELLVEQRCIRRQPVWVVAADEHQHWRPERWQFGSESLEIRGIALHVRNRLREPGAGIGLHIVVSDNRWHVVVLDGSDGLADDVCRIELLERLDATSVDEGLEQTVYLE